MFAGCTSDEPYYTTESNPTIFPADGELPVVAYAEAGPDWTIYTDPQNRFTLKYPTDWVQTDATNEVQFWDNLDDGVNSIKMSLTEETRSIEEILSQEPEDFGPNFERYFYFYDVNGRVAMSEVGMSDISDYRTYYYDLGDGELVALTALFHDDDEQAWHDALSIQQSFQLMD